MTEVNSHDLAPHTAVRPDMLDDTSITTQTSSQTSQLATAQEWPTPEPSMEFPTKEFLDKNFRKPDLQKRCRELGLTNIWRSKGELIDMILHHLRLQQNQTPADDIGSPVTPSEVMEDIMPTPTPRNGTDRDDQDADQPDLTVISRKIKALENKLTIKDMEMELLNTEMKSAFHTIEILQQRVNELEQQCKKTSDHITPPIRTAPPNKCLLLGDTNLTHVLPSDLQNNCWVRTIHGANMDLIRCWVTEKMSKIPSECIVYCGIQDIVDEKSPTIILDILGSLISDLKEKNANMKVYVCQIVPTPTSQELNTNIKNYNDLLTNWGEANGIHVIKTPPIFRHGTDEIDDMCFNTENETFPVLNRLGVVKLLTTIKRQSAEFHLCTNWDEAKKSTCSYDSQLEGQR